MTDLRLAARIGPTHKQIEALIYEPERGGGVVVIPLTVKRARTLALDLLALAEEVEHITGD